MDGVFIGVLSGIVLCFIAYKYIQMKKKKDTSVNEPKNPSVPTGGGSEKPKQDK